MMKKSKILLAIILGGVLFSSFVQNNKETYSLTIEVNGLRNLEGHVQFALYNKDGSVPDEKYKKYYKMKIGEINKNSSSITFYKIPKGKYAVNILHDENKDGKIDKGWIFPTEGIGFSNLKSISPFNKPNFKKTSFELNSNQTIEVKIIYL
jgi:uncharacterized protein (DUF2141 family)